MIRTRRTTGLRYSGIRASIALVALAVNVGWQSPCAAQQSGSAAAQVLFEEARQLMSAGHYAEACPKLEESQRIDPGSGTLMNLADCYEHTGRIASAWGAFLDAEAGARLVGNTAREQAARERSRALEPRLPRIVYQVGGHVEGLEIRRDGVLVGYPQWGTPIPIDPGDHSITVTAPGYKPWTTQISARESTPPVTLVIPELQPADPRPPKPGEPMPPPPREPGLGTQRTLALVAGGVGVAGVIVGSIYGLRSSAKNSDADPYCDSDGGCWDERGYDDMEDAVAAGNVSTVAFIVGGAGLAAGAVLWFTAPSGDAGSGQTALGVGPGSIRLRTTW
jgi:hypothetical protein